jgi:hypothetical protein
MIEQLRANAARIAALVEPVSAEQAAWKPDPKSWSILEVVNHLLDEEKLDFRVRLDLLLHQPGAAWPPIDPQGWVSQRGYNQRSLDPSLAEFLAERQASLDWLAGLSGANWQTTAAAPWGGVLHAGDLLAAWAAHDTLHLRQLVELVHAWVTHLAEPFDSGYAGEW